GQLEDADFRPVSDVEHLADAARLFNQAEQRRDDVANPRETAGLRTGAVNDDRLPGEREADEAGDDHAVPAALSRADRVEEAHDDHGRLAFLPVREREELVD